MPDVDDELVWKGAWAAATAYDELDAVYAGSVVYVCVDAHTSAENNGPPDADFWELAAPSSVGDPYASVLEYRDAIGKTDDADDTTILRHLKAVTRLFERETGMWFGKDAVATTRLFKARYSDLLMLDYEHPCPGLASTVGVEIKVDTDSDGSFADETAWASTDYRLEPLQAASGPEPKPWHTIRAIGNQRFSTSALTQVTGIFGWPSVPEGVHAWVIEMTGIWRSENPRATGRMNELEEVVATSPVALSAVKRMKDAYMARVTL